MDLNLSTQQLGEEHRTLTSSLLEKEHVTRGWQHGVCALECTCLGCTCCAGMWKGACVPSPTLSSCSHCWHNLWSKFFFTIRVPVRSSPVMVANLKTTSAFSLRLKSLQLIVSVGVGLGLQHSWNLDWALLLGRVVPKCGLCPCSFSCPSVSLRFFCKCCNLPYFAGYTVHLCF